MKDEEDLSFHFPHDALADAPEAHDAPTLGRRERWGDRAQQGRARDAGALERLADDAWPQRLEVDRNIREFRHRRYSQAEACARQALSLRTMSAEHTLQGVNTCRATSTRPNGALTCTPCTSCFTFVNMSRAIATPSASAASFPFSCAFRIRCKTSSGTETPGTSFARNSAFRREMSGQMPATIGVLNCSTRFRNASSWRASNTGCVTANSAPASTFHANRDSSRS